MAFQFTSIKITLAVFFAVILASHGDVLRNRAYPNSGESEASFENMELEGSRPGPPVVESLPFYGGAKDKLLLTSPFGNPIIVDRDAIVPGTLKEVRKTEEESNVSMEDEVSASDTSSNGENAYQLDSTYVGAPAENASVAEAKPVGLAIAGPGGVASSKPVGTAIVGPGGLAVARPVGTAIAGIEGAEALAGLGAGQQQQQLQHMLKRRKFQIPSTLVKEYENETTDDVNRAKRSNVFQSAF